MISLCLPLEREFDDYVTIRRLNQWYVLINKSKGMEHMDRLPIEY